jgi:hypothetical protein
VTLGSLKTGKLYGIEKAAAAAPEWRILHHGQELVFTSIHDVHRWCMAQGGHTPPIGADECHRCGLNGKVIRAAMFEADRKAKANQERMNLADECGRLRDENRTLLVESAELRREVERLKRRK